MQSIVHYIKGVVAEMKKVSWPSWDEVKGATTLVVALSLIFATIVKGFDLGISQIIGRILKLKL